MLNVFALTIATAIHGNPSAAHAPSKSFVVIGRFVEGCSCMSPCPCQLSGLMDGCQGVGVLNVSEGSFGGQSMSGSTIMYAAAPGKWVTLYIDAPSAAKRKAAEAFARAYYSAFGPIRSVKAASIKFAGASGKYSVNVSGGCTMSIKTEPILGGDGKTPMSVSNIHDPVHSTVWMGRTIACSFKDGEKEFTLSSSNSYFVPRLSSHGKL